MNTEPLDKLGAVVRLEQEEEELGLEYVGPNKGQNRAQRRAALRSIRALTRPPVACVRLRHPLLKSLTPWGANRLRRRRAANKVARAARKRNRKAK